MLYKGLVTNFREGGGAECERGGGGAEKFSSMLKGGGGTNSFEVVFTW